MGAFSAPLGERLSTRDNNLNLIRFVAATAVLVSHAWPIALGNGTAEPLEHMLGHSLGYIAVMVFFVASGFLITASFDRRRSLADFLRARAARLMPGLAVSMLVVALIAGPMVTDLPPASYLADPQTWTFLVRNITLVKPQYDLPGVFTTNPFPKVEGSIWTLAYEVACYGGVVGFGALGLIARRGPGTAVLVAWLLCAAGAKAAGVTLFYQADQLLLLSQPFAFGMLAYLWRDRLPVHPALLIVLAVAAAMTRTTPLYSALLILTIAYATLFLAAWPGGAIRAYNRLGDVSYGIYIYAFPVQGLAVWWFGPQSPALNILISFPLTLAVAILSWRLVEKPALDWARGSRKGSLPARTGIRP
jgi:peptidoglycan/LPS O-acetylase OafA/YrhL